jgi:DNA polymerase
VKPAVIVALGATAARAVIGKDFKVSLMRGRFVDSPLAPRVFATFHPSALLRLQDEAEKEAAFTQLVGDLKLIRKALSGP